MRELSPTAGQLARLAVDGALGVTGVAAPYAGPDGRWATPDRDGAVAGAVVVAVGDGRYEVALHLIARPVPLHALADRVRDAVRDAAAKAGASDALGPVPVFWEGIADFEEEHS